MSIWSCQTTALSISSWTSLLYSPAEISVQKSDSNICRMSEHDIPALSDNAVKTAGCFAPNMKHAAFAAYDERNEKWEFCSLLYWKIKIPPRSNIGSSREFFCRVLSEKYPLLKMINALSQTQKDWILLVFHLTPWWHIICQSEVLVQEFCKNQRGLFANAYEKWYIIRI